MTNFHVLTGWDQPKLWLRRDQPEGAATQLQYDAQYLRLEAPNLHQFHAVLDHQVQPPAHAQLYTNKPNDREWERPEHIKNLPRTAGYRFHKDYWFAHGAARVLTDDPFNLSQDHVRIHLITANRYRGGKLLTWSPSQPSRWFDTAGSDDDGPYFDVPLAGRDQHLFLFKFADSEGKDVELDYANRLWSSHDGPEIWSHSQSAALSSQRPLKKTLVVRTFQADPTILPQMHLWQESSDFKTDVAASGGGGNWRHYEFPIYTDVSYHFMFFVPGPAAEWENEEARRNVFLKDDTETWTVDGDGTQRLLGQEGLWTLQGDHEVFGTEPAADRNVTVEISNVAPGAELNGPLTLDVWVNRARTLLYGDLRPDQNGLWSFQTFPKIVTSFRFKSANQTEPIDRHPLKVLSTDISPLHCFVVLGRADPVPTKPPRDLFKNPPFEIQRPGPWVADGQLRFAVHCPTAATVDIIGDWTKWENAPLGMRSTLDGAYWWAEVPMANVQSNSGLNTIDGVHYKFVLSQTRLVQDPGADWVEDSNPNSASRLVDHARYAWKSTAWIRPGWEYLTVYQLHPSRFARRANTTGLASITRELVDPNGYLRQVSATALLLMPTCEFAGSLGWGYNPSFYYSVESSYGGPQALKDLVDAAHARGLAVLLDVVFNHAGTSDNVLWAVANESYFDGDTEWGAMINFDHPQVIHFFEQNLAHFMTNYRIDGFRFDFTRVIRYGGTWSAYVRKPGSGGGWEFMKRLQAKVRSLDSRCLMMAENYPNDWDLTQGNGPMDTQWCDNFHDRMVDASRGWDVMGPLADALKLTQTDGGSWQTATNFPESHDEVGNEPNRIVNVAGFGQGFRRNKVAAAATLFSRGIPLWFMGAESGEWRQFKADQDDALPLDTYEQDDSAKRIRAWWNKLCELRRGNPRMQGPAPLSVQFAENGILALTRGDAGDLFILLNFSPWSGWRPLAELNLPDGDYKELLNSTWGDFRLASENEDEHSNGGWDAHLRRDQFLNVPDYGVVVLARR